MNWLLKDYKIFSDISELKKALLNNEDTTSLMLRYEDDMKGAEFTEVENFLNSKEMKLILSNKRNDKKQKLTRLFMQHKIECSISKYIDAVLGSSDTAQIIE